jgi:hypothetical protein
LIYTSRSQASPVPRLWRIPADGGTPTDMMISTDMRTNQFFVTLAPDGRRIAYTAGRSAFEIWVMDNVLGR